MSEPTKRRPLLYEGDIIFLSDFILGNVSDFLSHAKFELMGVEETPHGKILEVRKAEDDRN